MSVILIDNAAITAQATRLIERSRERRYLIGIAGIGGSGKSTLAGMLREACEAISPGAVKLVPMDGFHLRDHVLDRRGLRHVKGAPETFDVEAYVAMLHRISGETDESITFPIYDRHLHEPALPGDAAHTIDRETHLVITEGNYLLLDEPPWTAMAGVLEECWFLDTPIGQAKKWIVARHVRGGRNEADALAHYERADRVNAERVLRSQRRPDLVLRWPEHYTSPT